MNDSIEKIYDGDQFLALILRASFREPGVHFVTPDNLSQQLAFMCHPKGKKIRPHVHNRVDRVVQYTQEVLVIFKGVMKVDFYSDDQKYLESRLLSAGDAILLANGGHGFSVIEEVQMLEIKQGPFGGEGDKTRFDPPEHVG